MHETIRCSKCNRILKGDASIKRGIGSTCWRKMMAGKRRRGRLPKLRVEIDWRQLDLPLVHQEPAGSSTL